MTISAADCGSFTRVRLGFEDRPATGRGRPPGRRSLVGARGFEPPTSRSRTVRATRLRYAPTRPDHCTQVGHASHAYFPTSLTNLHSPHSRVFISPPTFSTSVSTWFTASPIGTTIRPPSASCWKSTRLNSSHGYISYAVFCLKKKKETRKTHDRS